MNNTTEAYANSNNFTSSPANNLFSFLSSLYGGVGFLRAVSASRSATKGGTKRGCILPPYQVPLWLTAPTACATNLLLQDTSGKERGGGWGGVGVFEIQPGFPL